MTADLNSDLIKQTWVYVAEPTATQSVLRHVKRLLKTAACCVPRKSVGSQLRINWYGSVKRLLLRRSGPRRLPGMPLSRGPVAVV